MPWGPLMKCWSMSFEASNSFPWKMRRRTSSKATSDSVELLLWGDPLQNVSSFSCISSVSVPP